MYIFLFTALLLLLLLWKNVEGFDSLENCLNQGYPPKFCKRVPIQAYI